MLVCKITYATFDTKQGKIIDGERTAVVASTKSKNVLIDDMKQENCFEKSTTVTEIFVDKTAVENALRDVFAKQHPSIANELVAHATKALDGACMFKRPKAE